MVEEEEERYLTQISEEGRGVSAKIVCERHAPDPRMPSGGGGGTQ